MTEIRNLREDELEKWFDFLTDEIFQGDPRKMFEDMWYEDFARDINGLFAAYDSCGNIIGSVQSSCKNLLINGESVYSGIISGAGTKKDHRNQGISKQLFEVCHKYLKEKNAKLSHLYSKPDTLAFYYKLGYLNLPQLPNESFYRMYYVVSPFMIGDVQITDTAQFINLTQ